MAEPPRILIVTAAFGEGHNSAARNLGLALDTAGAVTRICDPCSLGAPRLTAVVSQAYRIVTTHFPRLWGRIYQSTDRHNFGRKDAPVLRQVERALAKLMEEFRPNCIVSTYPLYPYFLPRIFEKSDHRLPVFTVITDSIEINAAWLRAPSDWWLVTDSLTRERMVSKGLPAERIIDMGFPVNPVFSTLEPVATTAACDPFKILYFPTAKLPLIGLNSRALLEASPTVRLTMVLGRNVRHLYSRARQVKDAYPERVRLIGWTRKVPQLLNNHHLVVGKAGGATVHEAIAARCPMLIHHLVPGQEEGNLRLLEAIGGGGLADTPETLNRKIVELLSNDAAAWSAMKHSLASHGRNAGATAAAKFIINPSEIHS